MNYDSKTVIIDCYDSFTYNIYELLRRSGREDYQVIRVSDNLPDELLNSGKIILSPGPGTPDEYPELFRLLKRIIKSSRRIPVLGICLGHQILCSFFGAELYNLPYVVHGQPHKIRTLSDDILFDGIPDEFTAGLYHSWAVGKPLPEELTVTAESEAGIIMAVKHREYPFYGLQFHPESFISEYGELIIGNFLDS